MQNTLHKENEIDLSNEESPLLLTHERIRSTVQYLKRKKIWLLAAALLGLAFSTYFCIVKKPKYTAALSFSLEAAESTPVGGLFGLAQQFGLSIGGNVGGIFEGDNIIELFKSRLIIEQTLLHEYQNSGTTNADVFLDAVAWRKKFDIPKTVYPLGADKNKLTREQDSLMAAMYDYIVKNLIVVQRPDKMLNKYEVVYTTNDESFTKFFTEALVRDVSNFYIDTKTKRAKQNVELLEKRTDSIKQAYYLALYGKASMSDANLNAAFQQSQIGQQKKEADITVFSATYAELLNNLELAKYALQKETPYMQIIDEPRFPLEKTTYPWWLYIPLGIIAFSCIMAGSLFFIKTMGIIYYGYMR